MPRIQIWRRYLRFWGANPIADVDDEIRFHLETKIQELRESGLSEQDARTEALRQFGNLPSFRTQCEQIGKEQQKKMNRLESLSSWWQDIR